MQVAVGAQTAVREARGIHPVGVVAGDAGRIVVRPGRGVGRDVFDRPGRPVGRRPRQLGVRHLGGSGETDHAVRGRTLVPVAPRGRIPVAVGVLVAVVVEVHLPGRLGGGGAEVGGVQMGRVGVRGTVG